ncbi:putative membrane protein [Clostridioides difficile CD45]|nr:putative membrane protein [Clostridioides difficile CD22]EQE66039.1 putative membrane protein [Clostridioides difficile CD45]EQF40493.1 putative membrane protein [Clostridioides difficile CD169]EQF53005.1 putative membrane protein [Clostridioides difficile CD178]EQG46917.1 putative membrane protein [Clostridioides difficile DA00134]EQH30285.1 putative membrane protein [Clostridioides difficile DA00215]EQJ93162.1 putative membrane protein [Clostridioides difficile P49]EQK05178.1 putative m
MLYKQVLVYIIATKMLKVNIFVAFLAILIVITKKVAIM